MPCYHPWNHIQGSSSRQLSCGQCIGCRLEKSRQWAVRCVHEAQLYEQNCYVTLTYDDEHLPENNSLQYRDFQLFMKRLRKRYADKTIRFYMAGEYGEENRRPHFHAALFNHDFHDKQHHRITSQKHTLYTSPTLDQLWSNGYSSIGALTFQSAAYIARYILKKITGQNENLHYQKTLETTGEIINLKPEFNNMSRRPGIGHDWLKKFKTDVYPRGTGRSPVQGGKTAGLSRPGTVIINGHQARAPRYYDNLYKKSNPSSYRRLIAQRAEEALKTIDDNNDSRLKAKQTVKAAQLAQLRRKL